MPIYDSPIDSSKFTSNYYQDVKFYPPMHNFGMISTQFQSSPSIISCYHDSENTSSNCSSSISDDFSQFDDEHVSCLLQSLQLTESFDKLGKLLDQMPRERQEALEEALVSKAFVLYHQLRFEELFDHLKSFKFSTIYHKKLQELWKCAHYEQARVNRCGKREIDPVAKYRIRKKHPFPSTIWDGEGTSYCFKVKDRTILQQAYNKNSMPNPSQKKALSELTGLDPGQVSNWFKNRRQRDRQNKNVRYGSRGCSSDSHESPQSPSSAPISPDNSISHHTSFNNNNNISEESSTNPSSLISNILPPFLSSTDDSSAVGIAAAAAVGATSSQANRYWMPPAYPSSLYPTSTLTTSSSNIPYFGNFEHLQQFAAVYGNNCYGAVSDAKYQNL